MIGKSAKQRCFKQVRNLPCRYRSQKKSWMDGTLFEEWLRELDRKFDMQGRKIIMVVDNCPTHSDTSGLKAIIIYNFCHEIPLCVHSLLIRGLSGMFLFMIFYHFRLRNHYRMF